MTDAEHQRLAHILGMLGSDSVGERAAAALQAEAFRKRHGMTWAEMMSGTPPSWAQQSEDLMRAASERIAELEAEIQILAQRRPVAASPPQPVPQPWVSPITLQGLRNFLSVAVLTVGPFAIICGLAYWLR
jgi:hypothetical protein